MIYKYNLINDEAYNFICDTIIDFVHSYYNHTMITLEEEKETLKKIWFREALCKIYFLCYVKFVSKHIFIKVLYIS